MDAAAGSYGYSQALPQHNPSRPSNVGLSHGGVSNGQMSDLEFSALFEHFSLTQRSLSNFDSSHTSPTSTYQHTERSTGGQHAPYFEPHHSTATRGPKSRVSEFSIPLHRIHEVDAQVPAQHRMDDAPRPGRRRPNAGENQHPLSSPTHSDAPFYALRTGSGSSHIHAPAPRRPIALSRAGGDLRNTNLVPAHSRLVNKNTCSLLDDPVYFTQQNGTMATPGLDDYSKVLEVLSMQPGQFQEFMDYRTPPNVGSQHATVDIVMQELPEYTWGGVASADAGETLDAHVPRSMRCISTNNSKDPKSSDGETSTPKESNDNPSDYFTRLANWDRKPDTPKVARNGFATNASNPHGIGVGGVRSGSVEDATRARNTSAASGLDPIAAFQLYDALVPQARRTDGDPSLDTTLPFLGPFGVPSYSSLRPDQLTRPVLRWYCKTGAIHFCSCGKNFRHCRDLYHHIVQTGGNHSLAESTPKAIWVCPLCVRFQRAEVRILIDHMEEQHGIDFADAIRDTHGDLIADASENSTLTLERNGAGPHMSQPFPSGGQEATAISTHLSGPAKRLRRKQTSSNGLGREQGEDIPPFPLRDAISTENLVYQYFMQVYKLWNPEQKSDNEQRRQKWGTFIWSLVQNTPQSLRQWNRAASKFAEMENANEVVSYMIAGGLLECPSTVKRFNRDTRPDSLPQFITFGPRIFV